MLSIGLENVSFIPGVKLAYELGMKWFSQGSVNYNKKIKYLEDTDIWSKLRTVILGIFLLFFLKRQKRIEMFIKTYVVEFLRRKWNQFCEVFL